MSVLSVEDVIEFPSKSIFDEITDGDTLDIISPFYSAWSIGRLPARPTTRIRLITRLPEQYHSAPFVLENDPRPLKKAMDKLGSRLTIFALPSVHAKLYICPQTAWLGSANFTRNGFSGKGELLLRISPVQDNIRATFHRFIGQSVRVQATDVSFLINCLRDGITKLALQPSAGGALGDNLETIASVSYEEFATWLASRPDAGYILDRVSNKNRMSGHVYSGFYGVSAFLRLNPKLGRALAKSEPGAESMTLEKLADFVRKYGSKFGGPRGGTWNSKLSIRLGGLQSGGGAGDVVVKHLLPLVASYLRHKRVI